MRLISLKFLKIKAGKAVGWLHGKPVILFDPDVLLTEDYHVKLLLDNLDAGISISMKTEV